MDFNADYFTLFGLPRVFNLDGSVLDARYRELQANVHPDRFADASDADRRLSMQWATRANEAYQALKKPLARAQYLLHLADHDLGAENNTSMPVDFLMEQMEWREAAHEARQAGRVEELEDLHFRLRDVVAERYAELGRLFDEAGDYAAAADLTRRLMFLEKLQHDIDEALVALEDQ